MTYVSYQRSYRPAGRLATRQRQYDTSVLFHPEEIADSLDAGLKSTFLDGRLQANLNVYRQEFDGLIGLSTGVATDGGARGYF